MYQKSRRQLVLPFLLPAAILYTVITIYPIVRTVVFSFTDWQGHTNNFSFNGLGNYLLLFSDNLFYGALKNTLMLAVIGGVILFIPGLFMAWSLVQPIRFKGFFRFIILAPVVISVVVAGLLWKFLYNPSFGLIDSFLKLIGLGSIALPWLGMPETALTAIIIASVWHGIGLWVLLLISGMERIPPELTEAARLDGAGEWQVFRVVTLPLLWEVLRILVVLWVIQALQAFTFIFVMTGPVMVGGPIGSTETMVTYTYGQAFQSFHWGYAMALATALLVIIFVLSRLTNRVLARESVEF